MAFRFQFSMPYEFMFFLGLLWHPGVFSEPKCVKAAETESAEGSSKELRAAIDAAMARVQGEPDFVRPSVNIAREQRVSEFKAAYRHFWASFQDKDRVLRQADLNLKTRQELVRELYKLLKAEFDNNLRASPPTRDMWRRIAYGADYLFRLIDETSYPSSQTQGAQPQQATQGVGPNPSPGSQGGLQESQSAEKSSDAKPDLAQKRGDGDAQGANSPQGGEGKKKDSEASAQAGSAQKGSSSSSETGNQGLSANSRDRGAKEGGAEASSLDVAQVDRPSNEGSESLPMDSKVSGSSQKGNAEDKDSGKAKGIGNRDKSGETPGGVGSQGGQEGSGNSGSGKEGLGDRRGSSQGDPKGHQGGDSKKGLDHKDSDQEAEGKDRQKGNGGSSPSPGGRRTEVQDGVVIRPSHPSLTKVTVSEGGRNEFTRPPYVDPFQAQGGERGARGARSFLQHGRKLALPDPDKVLEMNKKILRARAFLALGSVHSSEALVASLESLDRHLRRAAGPLVQRDPDLQWIFHQLQEVRKQIRMSHLQWTDLGDLGRRLQEGDLLEQMRILHLFEKILELKKNIMGEASLNDSELRLLREIKEIARLRPAKPEDRLIGLALLGLKGGPLAETYLRQKYAIDSTGRKGHWHKLASDLREGRLANFLRAIAVRPHILHPPIFSSVADRAIRRPHEELSYVNPKKRRKTGEPRDWSEVEEIGNGRELLLLSIAEEDLTERVRFRPKDAEESARPTEDTKLIANFIIWDGSGSMFSPSERPARIAVETALVASLADQSMEAAVDGEVKVVNFTVGFGSGVSDLRRLNSREENQAYFDSLMESYLPMVDGAGTNFTKVITTAYAMISKIAKEHPELAKVRFQLFTDGEDPGFADSLEQVERELKQTMKAVPDLEFSFAATAIDVGNEQFRDFVGQPKAVKYFGPHYQYQELLSQTVVAVIDAGYTVNLMVEDMAGLLGSIEALSSSGGVDYKYLGQSLTRLGQLPPGGLGPFFELLDRANGDFTEAYRWKEDALRDLKSLVNGALQNLVELDVPLYLPPEWRTSQKTRLIQHTLESLMDTTQVNNRGNIFNLASPDVRYRVANWLKQ